MSEESAGGDGAGGESAAEPAAQATPGPADPEKEELYRLLGIEVGGKETGQTVHRLSDVSKSVDAYGKAEQAQAQLQQIMVRDLMRVVAENHECILSQSAALARNEAEIDALKKALLAMVQQSSSATRIDGISTDLDDLRAQLAALQKSVDEKLSADNSAALAALQKKFANMMTAQESQGKQLDKAWGYITADEAAEEVVQGAFDNEANTAEEDEMYQQLLKRTNAIAGSQHSKNLMSGLLGLGNIENAFHEWVANTALSKKIRADQAEEARLAAKAEADRRALEALDAEAQAKALADLEAKEEADRVAKEQADSKFKKDRGIKNLAKMRSKAKVAGKVAALGSKAHNEQEDLTGDKVKHKLEQKRREQQMMKDVKFLMTEWKQTVDGHMEKVDTEQVVQNKDIDRLSDESATHATMLSSMRAELNSALMGINAVNDAMKAMQQQIDKQGLNEATGLDDATLDRLSQMEAMMEQLAGIEALRQQLQGHASRLAELASTKAGKDDLAALSARLTGMDRKFMDELATRARELGDTLSNVQSGLEVRIGELDVTVGGKADVLMLEELEKSLRDELARLAKMGEGSISRDLLDRALADLRRKLEAELLGDKEDENGSAAYRCLACDRPLPPKDQWRLKNRALHSASIPHDDSNASPRGVETYNGVPDHLGPGMLANAQGLVHGISTLAPGGSGGIATDGLTPQWEPEIVYRAGFPTVTRPPAGVDGRMSHLQARPNSSMATFNQWGQRDGGPASGPNSRASSRPSSRDSMGHASMPGDSRLMPSQMSLDSALMSGVAAGYQGGGGGGGGGGGLNRTISSGVRMSAEPGASLPGFEPWGSHFHGSVGRADGHGMGGKAVRGR